MESAPNKNPVAGLPSADAVRNLLRAVVDPELGDNVVDLGMVGEISVTDEGVVHVGFKLTIKGCPLRAQLKKDIESRQIGRAHV